MIRLLTITLTAIATTVPAIAEDVIRPIDERFATTAAGEVPDFQRHVVPLLGKLGCNGRACHGSFQGQGGFRLSLFGYDFKMDHDGLGERIDSDSADDSYALQKPTLQEPHEGGKRMEVGSWEYRVLREWIVGGAKPVSPKAPKFVRLDVTPQEIVFASADDQVQLKVVAVWSDGTHEDVTPICRFQTNDEQVAAIDSRGLIEANEPGDSHVVIFYDSGVVPIPVMRPVSTQIGDQYPFVATPTPIDGFVVNKLKKMGIVPSEICNDTEFLRRVSLDITGTLPTPAEITAFVADSSSDKRSKKINELLERPSYAAWWTTQLCDFTGNSDDQLNNVTPVRSRASEDWYNWIHKRVAENVKYDELVEGIVMATSRDSGESYREYCETMSAMYAKQPKGSFAERESLPHYWARRNFQQPDERAIGFAYTFLGMRIQCAQCHKHPFDQWTQDDFKQFTGFFTGTSGRTQNAAPENAKEYRQMLATLKTDGLKGNQLRNKLGSLAKDGAVIPWGEVYSTPPAPKPSKNGKNNKPDRNRSRTAASAKLLGGDVIDLTEHQDVREPLMAWLRSPENKRFSRAFVNRVWSTYFNRGIVEPPDDLSLANPPCNQELLDYLTDGFIDSGFDMKWVHREIANSGTYQRSWQPNDTNRLDERNFSRFVPRRLPAEVAFDVLTQATSADTRFTSLQTNVEDRAITIPGSGARGRYTGNRDLLYAMQIFGRSIRESNCDCDRSQEASLLQTVFMRNDSQVLAMLDDTKNGWLAQIAKESGLSFNPRSSNGGSPSRPDNWEKYLTAMQKQINQVQAGGNGKKARELRQKVAAYMKKYRISRDELKQGDNEESGSDVAAKNDATSEKIQTDEVIRQAYLRTLSRLPNDNEVEVAMAYMNDNRDPLNGVRDLLWALINTKEFIVNH